jgi:hypothetical protein
MLSGAWPCHLLPGPDGRNNLSPVVPVATYVARTAYDPAQTAYDSLGREDAPSGVIDPLRTSPGAHAFRRIFTVALRGIPGPGCPLEPLLLAALLAVPAHRGIPHKKIRR